MASSATVIQNQRETRAAQLADDLKQVASMNPDTPFQDGQTTLAESIKELHDSSLEYKGLKLEQDKQEFDALALRNATKQEEWKENRELETSVRKHGAEAEHVSRAQYLLRQMESVQIPAGQTAATMDKGKLAHLASLSQQWEQLRNAAPELNLPAYDTSVFDPSHPLDQTLALAQQAPQAQRIPTQQSKPVAFDDGKYAHITKNPDGTLHLEVPTGEKYDGSVEEIMEKQAKSLVHTKRWAQDQRNNSPQQVQAQPQQVPNQLPDNPNQAASIADYWAQQQSEALARRYGFSNEEEMVQHFGKLSAQAERMQDMETASAFMAACPDFPCTEEASNTVAQIVNQSGWEFTPQSMEAAYRLAVARGQVRPLPAEAQDAQSGNVTRQRPAAPPMISSQSPDASSQNWNPWDTKAVNLADLRRAAIAQELEGKR